jgi:hypothetical protein
MAADIQQKRVPEMDVLTVRRSLKGQGDIIRELESLAPAVSDLLTGPPMALSLGFPRDGITDFDLCFPVNGPVERDGFELKRLPELPLLTVTHRGPIAGGPEGSSLADSWKEFAEFVGSRSLLLGDDPQRYIYHEGIGSADVEPPHYVLEIQCSYHLPMWLEAFAGGLSQCVDEPVAERILEGSEELADALDGRRAASWVQGAVARLDEAVSDERARACVLNACAHHYIVQSGEVMASLWEESGHDLRALLELVSAEPLLGSTYWIDESGPEPLLMIRRRPARMDAYEKAEDPAEKRYQACFCPLVRDALREGKPVSRTFCHCSGGWYVQEWAIVFGQDPEVALVETMLEGADACVFAVKIPAAFL